MVFARHLLLTLLPPLTTLQNTAMAAMSFIHSSTSHGLDTCAMEGYDVLRVREALRIPDRYDIPLMVSVGYGMDEEFEEIKRTNRLQVGEVFFDDTFGNPTCE